MLEETSPERRNTPSPRDLLRVLWRRLWVIVLVAIVLMGSATGFSLLQAPTYEASVTLFIGQKATDDSTNLSGNVEGVQQLTTTMTEAVTTLPVAQGVVEELDLSSRNAEGLLENLSAEQQIETSLIEVTYRDTDPQRAQLVANTVGQVFSEQVEELSPRASGVTATVLEPAVAPETPVNPDPLRNGLLALVFGVLLGAGLAFLLEYLDDSWSSPEEVERVSGVPTFGIIPEFEVLESKEGKK